MKKLFTVILFLTSVGAFAQPTCPPGNLNQLSKWKFLFSQCMEDSLFLNYAQTQQVAYVDQGGVLTTISFSQLLDSLGLTPTHYPDSAVVFGASDGSATTDSSRFFYSSGMLFLQSGLVKNYQSSLSFSNGFRTAGGIGSNSQFYVAASGAPSSLTSAPNLFFVRARGTVSSPSQVLANNYIGRISFRGFGDTATVSGGSLEIRCQATGPMDLGGNSPLELQVARVDNSSTTIPFRIDSTDLTTISSLNITTTPAAGSTDQLLTHASSGQVTQLGFAQGVFLAADSARSNIDALTLDSAMYTRVGNIVTVTGRATIDATATGTVTFYMSIPVASNMTSTTVAGVNSSLINAAGTVVFGTTQKVLFRYVAASAASQVQTYTYTYRIN